MKPLDKHLKPIALFLALIFLVSSCRVYHSKTVSVDEAVQSSKRIKVNSYNNEIFKFKQFQKEDGRLYGITRKNSYTAKKLSHQILGENIDRKYVNILLPDTLLKEIHLHDKTLSILIPVMIPISIIVGILITGGHSTAINFGE